MQSFSQITESMQKASIPPRMLLSKFRFLDEESKYSLACLDPNYMPFYYYLGKHCPSKNLLHLGFGLGLSAACYFQGSTRTENYLALQSKPKVHYSPRIGIANVKQVWHKPFYVHVGNIYDEQFPLDKHTWTTAIVEEKGNYDAHMLWLNMIWDRLDYDGMIIVDHTKSHEAANKSYQDFCIIKHREPFIFPSRYGAGVIVK